jgi:phage terminase large subunit GpA-like protein
MLGVRPTQRSNRLTLAKNGDEREGKTHFNRRFGEEYFQQLTVEQVTVTFERGLEIRKYVNPQQQRNEALDIEVGNLAAVRLYPRNFDTIEAELREQVKAKQQQQPATKISMSR